MANDKWTVMLYMAGDNNLSEDMISGLSQIGDSIPDLTKESVDLFAYFDPVATEFPSLLFDFSMKAIEKLNFEVRTSTRSIFKFAEWCVQQRAGDRERSYALILSGHGDGFQRTSFLNDESSDGHVTIKSIGKMLKDINENLLPNKLNILGLDSCVMSSVEFAYEISDAANVLVASQGLVPFAGWNYGRFLKHVDAKNVPISDSDMATAMKDAFIENYQPFKDYNGLSIEIASCKLFDSNLQLLAKSIYGLADGLIACLVADDETVQKRIEYALLYSHHSCQTHLVDQCVDIKDFCERLKEAANNISDENRLITAIANSCDGVVSQIDACASSRSIGPEFQFSNGLSLFFPWSYFSYLSTRNQYVDLDFGVGDSERRREHTADPSPWTRFLDVYLFATLRDNLGDTLKKSLIETGMESVNAEGGNAVLEEHKVNPLTSKVNPLNTKVNPMTTKMTSRAQFENFRRTKNFPWLPEPSVKQLFSPKTDPEN